MFCGGYVAGGPTRTRSRSSWPFSQAVTCSSSQPTWTPASLPGAIRSGCSVAASIVAGWLQCTTWAKPSSYSAAWSWAGVRSPPWLASATTGSSAAANSGRPDAASTGRRAAYDRTELGLASWLATHGLPASSVTYTKPPVASVASGTAIETR